MQIKKFLIFLDNLPFSYKSSILMFIITGGMISIIALSQISVYSMKNDFDTLFEKRTKPIIELENIKDIYKINVYDTFYDIQQRNLTIRQAKDIISLAQQLINQSWKNYKVATLETTYEKSFITNLLNKFFDVYDNENERILQKNLIFNINEKINELHREINTIVELLQREKLTDAILFIDRLYFEINSVNVYITNLTNHDLNLAITEKRETQQIFNLLTTILNYSIFFVFLSSLFLSVLLINNFRKLHFNLEDAVKEKTKELQELNEYLEIKIKKEVANSRKKT